MTPIYTDTVRATGIVPDGYPLAAEIPAGSVVVEFPAFRSGVALHYMPTMPAPLPASMAEPAVSRQAPIKVPSKRRKPPAIRQGR